MTDYAVCHKCNGLIYRGKATGREWQHIDYRQQSHRAIPVCQAAEIKIRAERRAGEMLREQIPHEGGRPEKPSQDTTVFEIPKLADLGITKDQSSRWQLEAQIPEEKFEGQTH